MHNIDLLVNSNCQAQSLSVFYIGEEMATVQHGLLASTGSNNITDGWQKTGLLTGFLAESESWSNAIETLGQFAEACGRDPTVDSAVPCDNDGSALKSLNVAM